MEILYEDESIIVVNKPAGLATQTKRVGEKDLESELKKHRKLKGEKPEIFIVHRLDQPVNGLLVTAKSPEAAAVLSKAVADRDFVKEYEAVIFKPEGFVNSGRLENYIMKEAGGNVSRIADGKIKNAGLSALSYETLEETDKTATLMVHLETGKHHQIRLQLSHAGMPILGDLKYGNEQSIAWSRENNIKFVALKSKHLSFAHPVTGEGMDFSL